MAESVHYIPADSLTMRAQEIIKQELDVIIPYRTMAKAIYDPLLVLARILNVGDTFELPNGTTVMVTFKPGQNRRA